MQLGKYSQEATPTGLQLGGGGGGGGGIIRPPYRISLIAFCTAIIHDDVGRLIITETKRRLEYSVVGSEKFIYILSKTGPF